jgi:hypothetical protein
LGTFTTPSPKIERVGDQEKPWNITLPKDNEAQKSDSNRPTDHGMSPVAAQYPLPESTVVSPVNPAAANLPLPPLPSQLSMPPSGPQQPNQDNARLISTSQAADPPGPEPNHTTAGPVILQQNVPSPEADPSYLNYLHRANEPVELPAEIPGDDSSEEIVMSSTAYPGQEWQPAFVGSWD